MPHAGPQSAPDLEAFCASCPDAQDVTALLAAQGFHLVFQMGEQPARSSHLPPLPAQYHYKDEARGTEVIFLAGRDAPLEQEVFPSHASRFWLYAGADPQISQRAQSSLALAFQLTWRDPSRPDTHEEAA